MIAPNLFADLTKRGVILSIAETPKGGELPPLRLRVRSVKPLPESLALAIIEHKAELLQFVFELEETAAILEHSQGIASAEATTGARACVRGGTATGDGAAWLKDYARKQLASVAHLLEPSDNWEVRRVA